MQRALRPLKRRIPSRLHQVLDEAATAAQIADRPPEHPWTPVLVPARERWLSLALVIDTAPAMGIWRLLAGELREAMFRLGAFRDLRVWLLADVADKVGIQASARSPVMEPAALIDTTGRQAIVVFSDCSGPHWWEGRARPAVHLWARHNPTAILQPLPERLWRRTAAPTVPGQAILTHPGAPSTGLRFTPHDRPVRHPPGTLPVPVIELSTDWLADWARLIAASGGPRDTAVTYLSGHVIRTDEPVAAERNMPVAERVLRFHTAASPQAAELAAHVAVAVPSLPVMQLIQHRMMPGSRPSDLAEVLLSGLLRPVDAVPGLYDFIDGARAELLKTLPRPESLATAEVLEQIAAEIQARAGTPASTFRAVMPVAAGTGSLSLDPDQRPFALVSAEALSMLHHTAIPVPGDAAPDNHRSAVTTPRPDSPAENGHVGRESTGSDGSSSDIAERHEPTGNRPAGSSAPSGYRPKPSGVIPAHGRDTDSQRPSYLETHSAPVTTETVRIALLGAPASGKTTYLAALPVATRTTGRTAGRWAIYPTNPASRDLLVDGFRQLEVEETFPEATVPDFSTPLEWLFVGHLTGSKFDRRPRWRRRKELVSRFMLDLIDVGGEVYRSDPHQSVASAALDHLASADGIIYLFDPIGERYNRDSGTYLPQVVNELLLRASGNSQRPAPYLPHQVSVCITKFDHPEVFQLARRMHLLTTGPDGMPRVRDEDAEQFFDELCSDRFWNERYERGQHSALYVRDQLRRIFRPDRIRYFVTSSIGFWLAPLAPGESALRFDEGDFRNCHEVDGRLKIRGPVRPINVLEPLISVQQRIARG
jgi:hypothetical protein